METMDQVVEKIRGVLDISIGTVGSTDFTIGRVLAIGLILLAMFRLTRWIRNWAIRRLSLRPGMQAGVAESIGSIVRYVLVFVAIIALAGTIGVDISSVVVVAGVLGLGIGLGLQGLVNDFVSGVVLLVERPVKVGDRIEVGELAGNVIKISPRATTIRTNDNITMIVPNSQFVSRSVINWSHHEPEVRLRVSVPVAYDSDPEQVRRVLLEAAARCEEVLRDRPPDVLFDEFGDSALVFTLRVWTRDLASRPGALRSELNFAILAALRDAGIVIPFPQRDLHVRMVPPS
jgi:small-conductance mechanosensitive channel